MIKKAFLKSYDFINNLLLVVITLIFILIPSFLVITLSTTFSILFGTKSRAWKLLVSLDQTLNTVFGGDEDETFSSRCHREGKTKPKYKHLEEFIDFLFFILRGELSHCRNAYHHELEKAKKKLEGEIE